MGESVRLRTATVLGVGVLLAAAGCSGGEADPPEPEAVASVTAQTPSPAPPPSPAPDDDSDDRADDADGQGDADAEADDSSADEPDGDAPEFPSDTSPAVQEPGGAQQLTVTDVRAGSHDGFDRVTFELGGEGTPGWNVEYVDEAFDDGSGERVEVDGDAILSVRIRGTAMPADSGVEEYDGATIDPDDGSVEEVVYRFWFEGYTTAFVGVDGDRRPFRVFTLEDPARVVVDIRR